MGDVFARSLARVLVHDTYLKKLDLVSNKISEHSFSLILKNALMDNFSLVNLDCRINPGCTPRIQARIALAMCKNIERVKSKGFPVKNDIDTAVYSAGIDPEILTKLDIKKPLRQKTEKSTRARSNSLQRGFSKLESECMSPGRLNDDFGLLGSEGEGTPCLGQS